MLYYQLERFLYENSMKVNSSLMMDFLKSSSNTYIKISKIDWSRLINILVCLKFA